MKAGIGSFDVNRFYSWYRCDVPMAQALAARMHETLHAEALAGTKFHLNVLNTHLSEAIGVPNLHLNVPEIVDFVHIQEAYPMAYQSTIKTGDSEFKLSNYVDEEVRRNAQITIDIANRVHAAYGAVIANPRKISSKQLILRAFYRCISNMYLESNGVDGQKFIESFEEMDFSSSKIRKIFELNFLPFNQGESLEAFFGEISSNIFGIPKTNRKPEFDFLYLYLNLALACSNEDSDMDVVDSQYFSLMQFAFPRMSDITLAYNKENSSLSLGTNGYFNKKFDRKFDQVMGEKLSNFENLPEIIRLYENKFDYAYNDFEERFLMGFPTLDLSFHGAHLRNLVNVFPSYLITIMDLIVCPIRSIVDKNVFSLMMEHFTSNGVDDRPTHLVKEYPIFRKRILQNLNRAAVDAPRQLALDFLRKNRTEIMYSTDTEIKNKDLAYFFICDDIESVLPIRGPSK